MLPKGWPLLAYFVSLALAADKPSPDPLEIVRGAFYAHSSGFHSDVKILSWNIERGKNLADIMDAIRSHPPQLCIFQEVDLGARRTQGRNVADELAKSMGLNYAFAPEFRELSQKTAAGPAYHGQATLTTMPIRSSRLLRFKYQSGFWKPRPFLISSMALFQRREGGRTALITELDNGGKVLVVYNLHLESKTTEGGRLLQLNEVLEDARRYPPATVVVIAGDLNTMSRHSPLIPRLVQDGYRSCFGDRRLRTHVIIGALDWVFVRGAARCEDAEVHREIHGSDHYPISLDLAFKR